MLFLFQVHQDDSGWTYSKVDIDDDDDDDSDDYDFVAYCLTDLTIERQKNNTILLYFQQFCPQSNYEAMMNMLHLPRIRTDLAKTLFITMVL